MASSIPASAPTDVARPARANAVAARPRAPRALAADRGGPVHRAARRRRGGGAVARAAGPDPPVAARPAVPAHARGGRRTSASLRHGSSRARRALARDLRLAGVAGDRLLRRGGGRPAGVGARHPRRLRGQPGGWRHHDRRGCPARLPVHPPRHRHHRRARPELSDAGRGHRALRLGLLRPHPALPGARPALARVRGGDPRPRRLRGARGVAPRAAQRDVVDRRRRHPRAGPVDRARGHAVVPGPRHPAAHAVLGRHDPGGPRLPRLRVVDLDLPGHRLDAHLDRREPDGRRAPRSARPDAAGGSDALGIKLDTRFVRPLR